MQFTPQQLAGAGKYGTGTRIGNWSEDVALEEQNEKAYRDLTQKGLRQIDALNRARSTGAHAVRISRCDDGFLRYGSLICIEHVATGARVASSLAPLAGDVGEFEASVAPGCTVPTSRTTFIVRRANGSMAADEFVRYNEDIVLATEPSLIIDPKSGLCQNPLFLISSPNGLSGSKSSSNAQEVRVAKVRDPSSDYYLRWRVQQLEVKPTKIGSETRVPVGTIVQVVHVATGKALGASEEFSNYNDYGAELELYCENDLPLGKMMRMNAEKVGKMTSEHRRMVGQRNYWHFITASDADNVPDRQLALICKENVLALARHLLYGRDVGSVLKSLDQAGDGMLIREDVKYALVDSGIDITDDEFDCLLDSFVLNRRSGISLEELCAALAPASPEDDGVEEKQ